jgi:hypothetical protein
MGRPSLVLLLCIVISACSGPESWPKRAFNAGQWAQAPETERYVFALDLVDRELLKGKTPEEVKEILGAPSSESSDEHYVTYVLKSGGLGFNQVYGLDVRFDPTTNTVKSVSIRGD